MTTPIFIRKRIPVREEIAITGGPHCDGRLVWWEAQSQGINGWVAEVNGYNNYNLIPWVAGSLQPQVQEVIVRSSFWNKDFRFLVNTRTCAIVNGAEMLSQEIALFDSHIGQFEVSDLLNRDVFEQYFNVNTGQTE